MASAEATIDFERKPVVNRLLGREGKLKSNPARLGIGIASGFVVTDVERNSPADQAGFQQGLIVEAIDGQAPDSIVTFARYLNGKKRGATVRLTLIVPGPFRRAEAELTEAARGWTMEVQRQPSLSDAEGCVLIISGLQRVGSE